MNNANGLVSIIMPLYNSEVYLETTLDTVLNQTYENWQLIIVDDFSTDNSYAIAERYMKKDQRIQLHKLDKKSKFGALDVRNECLKYATGRYITFLDSDDLWDIKFLESQINFLKEKKTGFICSSYNILINGNNKVFTPPAEFTYKYMLKTNPVSCLTAFYDLEVIKEKVQMPQNSYRREDYACFLQIIKRNGKVAYGNQEVLATYRIHSNSASSGKLKMAKYQYRVYRKVEKLNIFVSMYYLFCWAMFGLKKYRRS